MAEAKIEIKAGNVSFSGEGNEAWLSSQLDKVLKHLPDLVNAIPPLSNGGDAGDPSLPRKKAAGNLASYLNSKKVSASQARKFLATALWLQDNGNEHLTTAAVTSALSNNKQGKLTNASGSLADNVKRGFCEKGKGREFYVTDDGRDEIG